jgi:hypothetical protein
LHLWRIFSLFRGSQILHLTFNRSNLLSLSKGASMKRFILMAVLCISTAASAQKADAGFVVGGSFVSDTSGTVALGLVSVPTNIKTDHHFFLEGEFGLRVLNAHVAALYVELPVAGIPSTTITETISGTPVDHLSTVFITPGVRVKILPASPISPWASVGGGWARYSLNDSGLTQNKPAVSYGGGLDFKTGLPLLGFRAEVRDFLTGNPNFDLAAFNTTGKHHNILVGGGLVLRF